MGFKNGTDDGVQEAADPIVAASSPHVFMGMTKMGQAASCETRGNADGHIVLRGGGAPNYRAADIEATCAAQLAAGERRFTGVMIESHLRAGRQDLVLGRALQPGMSITDACLSWDDSVALLRALAQAQAVHQRRVAAS